ncbi:LOW QUALITY PROTEIN: tesmin [Gracilinanus agilis]|uniref:LOW QUALITY PROTEIN: tesmin n=1 Tax=Gracilinanus agilis TaxID=191870 RepID=UPI001CFE24DF|nr:LOW QUALITY PROTEIN: tesmin [Gracilinanus agilis]
MGQSSRAAIIVPREGEGYKHDIILGSQTDVPTVSATLGRKPPSGGLRFFPASPPAPLPSRCRLSPTLRSGCFSAARALPRGGTKPPPPQAVCQTPFSAPAFTRLQLQPVLEDEMRTPLLGMGSLKAPGETEAQGRRSTQVEARLGVAAAGTPEGGGTALGARTRRMLLSAGTSSTPRAHVPSCPSPSRAQRFLSPPLPLSTVFPLPTGARSGAVGAGARRPCPSQLGRVHGRVRVHGSRARSRARSRAGCEHAAATAQSFPAPLVLVLVLRPLRLLRDLARSSGPAMKGLLGRKLILEKENCRDEQFKISSVDLEDQPLLGGISSTEDEIVTEIFSQDSQFIPENINLKSAVISKHDDDEEFHSFKDAYFTAADPRETLLHSFNPPLNVDCNNKVKVERLVDENNEEEILEDYSSLPELNPLEETMLPSPSQLQPHAYNVHFLSSLRTQHRNPTSVLPLGAWAAREGAAHHNVRVIPVEIREAVGTITANNQEEAVFQNAHAQESCCKFPPSQEPMENSSCSHKKESNPMVICQLKGGTQMLCINNSGTRELKAVHLVPQYQEQNNYLQPDVSKPLTTLVGRFLPVPAKLNLITQQLDNGALSSVVNGTTFPSGSNLQGPAKITLAGVTLSSWDSKSKKPCNCTKSQCLKLKLSFSFEQFIAIQQTYIKHPWCAKYCAVPTFKDLTFYRGKSPKESLPKVFPNPSQNPLGVPSDGPFKSELPVAIAAVDRPAADRWDSDASGQQGAEKDIAGGDGVHRGHFYGSLQLTFLMNTFNTACLDRNPEAFQPKIGKGKLGDIKPRHNKGCNCKRSGCLKNYCECYEAKIMCSSICKCIGCKNYEESPERKTLLNMPNYVEIGGSEGGHLFSPSKFAVLPKFRKDRPPYTCISWEVVEATCACLLAQGEEAEKEHYSECLAEQMILEEFGRCLSQILHTEFKSKGLKVE